VPSTKADGLAIVDVPERQRYEAVLDGRTVGYTEYRRVSGRVIFFHTEVDEAMEGRGIGSGLASGALEDVRAQGLRFTSKCPFLSAWLARHHDFDDIQVRFER
jgi:predicted GNAT family acetyltransferase